jgi:hypothetical protein
MRGEEAVPALDDAPPPLRERPRRQQRSPPEPAAQQKAHVVAGDRRDRRQEDHGRDVQPALGGEHGSGDQRGLGGHRDADRLERHGHRHRDVPDAPGDADDAHRPAGSPQAASGRSPARRTRPRGA